MSLPFSVKENSYGRIKLNGQKEIPSVFLNKVVGDCVSLSNSVFYSVFQFLSFVRTLVTLEHDELLMIQQIFFVTSLLEYNCFTVVCQFLLYNKVNQLCIYICPHISSLLHLPPSHPPYPTPLGGHKAPS